MNIAIIKARSNSSKKQTMNFVGLCFFILYVYVIKIFNRLRIYFKYVYEN